MTPPDFYDERWLSLQHLRLLHINIQHARNWISQQLQLKQFQMLLLICSNLNIWRGYDSPVNISTSANNCYNWRIRIGQLHSSWIEFELKCFSLLSITFFITSKFQFFSVRPKWKKKLLRLKVIMSQSHCRRMHNLGILTAIDTCQEFRDKSNKYSYSA